MIPDRTLVAEVLQDAPGAFARLVDTHHALAWHVLLRLTNDREVARDLCQDTFLRVHDRLDTFRFESSLRTWIGRVAWSIGLRHLDRLARRPEGHADALDDAHHETLAGPEDVEAGYERHRQHRLVEQGMRALPAIQRTLVTLYHVDGLGIAEIMQVTGLPSGTVKVYLARARARLREQILAEGAHA